MQPLVSFIIPVYKIEKYLETCVQSILKQTYNDYEILLVDDGSPDRCPYLCDYWAGADKRIKALHKSNGGLSDARNYGLKYAVGKYVIFVDGDDYWTDENDLMNLMSFAHSHPNADFINFNCQYVYPDTKTAKWKPYSDQILQSSDKNTILQNLVKSGTFPMSAWLKLISRDFIVSNQLYFQKGLLSEDIPWFINLLDKSQECYFINQYIYSYRQGVSTSITSTFGEKHYDDLFKIIINELQNIDDRSFDVDAKASLISFIAYEYCILLSNLEIWQTKSKKKLKELSKYKWLLSYTTNPKVKAVKILYNLSGLFITSRVLSIYQKIKVKFHIKL